MKYTLYLLCSTKQCIELVEVTKHDNKEHFCSKCEKKKQRKGKKAS